jgi:hypothetical protein
MDIFDFFAKSHFWNVIVREPIFNLIFSESKCSGLSKISKRWLYSRQALSHFQRTTQRAREFDPPPLNSTLCQCMADVALGGRQKRGNETPYLATGDIYEKSKCNPAYT